MVAAMPMSWEIVDRIVHRYCNTLIFYCGRDGALQRDKSPKNAGEQERVKKKSIVGGAGKTQDFEGPK